MMRRIFVDTGAWYAAMVRKDRDHEAAKQFLHSNTSPLITSDYIMDETVTLLLSRVGHSYAIKFLDMLQTSQNVTLMYLTPEHIAATIDLFRKRPDKAWSFTDCSSFKRRSHLTSIFLKPVFKLSHPVLKMITLSIR